MESASLITPSYVSAPPAACDRFHKPSSPQEHAYRLNVPCNGNGGTSTVNKIAETITFGTSGNCQFIAFQFVPNDPPPGFSNKQPSNGAGATVSYDYDGLPIPSNGYSFSYTTDTPAAGNGTGVIKNS